METLTAKEQIEIIKKTVAELEKLPPDTEMPVTAAMFKMGMDLGYAMQQKMARVEEKKTPPPAPATPTAGYS
jgi:hypothetical protein